MTSTTYPPFQSCELSPVLFRMVQALGMFFGLATRARRLLPRLPRGLQHDVSRGVFNTTGQPAASVPMGYDEDDVPVGVQVAAPFGREDLVLAVSRQLEQAVPWSTAAICPPRQPPTA